MNPLIISREEVDYLEEYESYMDKETIGSSTVVKTNIGNFVVSVPLQVFTVEGETYMGVSTDSPIYEELEGHKEGDELEFNGQQIRIQRVI
ncbi:MAG: hypothetical protein U5L96_07455 [Owenweeksia sp.]|nr:hypothetical protein [Owenweeksia sp.]